MAPSGRSPIAVAPEGVTVAVRVTPRASRAAIKGIAVAADGSPHLAISVTVPPEDGKANAALIKLLAREWRLAKSAITVASGAASRRNTLHIAGDSRRLLLDLGARLTDMR